MVKIMAEAIVNFVPTGIPVGSPMFVGARMLRGEFGPGEHIVCVETGIEYVFFGLGVGVSASEFMDGVRLLRLRRADSNPDDGLAVGTHLVQHAKAT
jgi:hypothetical protein